MDDGNDGHAAVTFDHSTRASSGPPGPGLSGVAVAVAVRPVALPVATSRLLPVPLAVPPDPTRLPPQGVPIAQPPLPQRPHQPPPLVQEPPPRPVALRQAGAPARFIAAKSADGKPSWLYFFSYVATERRTPDSMGAAHAAEISYVFGGQMRPAGAPPAAAGSALAAPPTPSDEDKAMAALMHSCWVAFAKTGAPTCASGPAWPAYSPATDQLMEFGSPSGVRTNFRKEIGRAHV